jgi:protein tyrosine/serine phosphatase
VREPGATPADLSTREGRARAWRELMLDDHHVARLLYRNEHAVVPGKMWRSHQPSPAMLERWAKRGARTVVNLRGESPLGFYLLEEEACRRLGLRLVNFKVYSRDAPSKEALYGARRLFAEIEYPAVMHCKSGADRVGLMSALYLFFAERRPFDQALRQLSWRYGHVKHGKTGVIDYALGGYLSHAGENGGDLSCVDSFFRWVDAHYDPPAVKARFMATWWGNLLTERILSRE